MTSENSQKAFDLITTFDAIHDQIKPLNVLKGIHRALDERVKSTFDSC